MSLKNGLYIRLGTVFPAPYIGSDEIGSMMITIVINNVKAKSCILSDVYINSNNDYSTHRNHRYLYGQCIHVFWRY